LGLSDLTGFNIQQEINMIPSFLLAKLYVKGSLKNTDAGFEFTLKNIIDNTMLVGIGPVTVGEKTYEGAAILLTAGDKTVSGADLTRQNGVPARMGMLLIVAVSGDKLSPGVQKITVAGTSSDIGKFKFDLSDNVS
jgi:hypothetical protein